LQSDISDGEVCWGGWQEPQGLLGVTLFGVASASIAGPASLR
jgi:hypothetical protein